MKISWPYTTAITCLISFAVIAEQSAKKNTMPLDEGWAAFSAGLAAAKASLEDPKYFPPEPTERNLAEGYRYLLGHLNRLIEAEMRQHPRFPEFHRSMDMLRKWTIENPDTMYLKASIDETGYYKVIVKAANTSEWRNSARGTAGPKAPRLVTFQTITDIPGNTGKLAEMAQCKNQTLDFLNSFSLKMNDNDSFEILIGPEKPANFEGNFLLSRKRMPCPATKSEKMRSARWLAVREIFSDWENEKALDMNIERLDSIGTKRPPINIEEVNEKLAKIGNELPNQIRFWNLLHEYPLEVRGDTNGDGKRAMPLNGINQPAPPFTAGGVAGSQQIYAAGNFELEQDEALVIKVTTPVEPHYIGFQLGTLWGEGPDQQNYNSSLSGHQLPPANDGARYYVIAHADPGAPGWVDTTGLAKGTHSMRFVFRDMPIAKQMPTANAYHIKLTKLGAVLPADTAKISPESRREQIAIRQAHIKQRWRAY
ncbi:MAG: hypothetical protein ACR2P1_21855 [Pseudomonadales bacterium]